MSEVELTLKEDPVHPHFMKWEWWLLIVAIAAGALIRFWHLPRVPGLWYDEAINGLDALTILRDRWPIFFMTEGHPREPMYLYFEAIGVSMFGTTAWAIRSVSAFIGILTIPVVWIAAREAKGPYIAAVAAVTFALLRWHVMFSTLAFRTILAPLFAALTVWFFLRTIRTRKTSDAVLCGLSLGLGAYTYLAFRLMPLILIPPAILAIYTSQAGNLIHRTSADEPLHASKEFPKVHGLASRFLAIVGVAFIVFLPLGINYVKNPDHFSGRSGEVNFFDREDAISLLFKQARDVVLMPLVRGDHVGKHNFPGPPKFLQTSGINAEEVTAAWNDEKAIARESGRDTYNPHGTGVPVVNWLIGILFYLGFGLILCGARNEPADALIVSWILFGSLASILSFGAPNMLRLLMIAPAFVICIAAGFLFVVEKVTELADIAGILIGVLFLTVFLWNEMRLLYRWPEHPMVPTEFNSDMATLGHFLHEQPDRLPVRISQGFGMPPTLKFLADGYTFNPPAEELGEKWWEFRSQPPFPELNAWGTPVDDARRIDIQHPAGIPMGTLVEVH